MKAFRLDRFATLYLAQPLLSATSRNGTNYLPILMYHSISDTNEDGVSPYYRTVTPPAVFRMQMNSLRENGWKGVTLREGLRSFSTPVNGERKVVITFDDGFEDFYTAAYPALQENGFTATMYLPTAFIGETQKTFKDHRCMTWSQVRELHGTGIEFGSHTVNHPKLWELDWPEISKELSDSKKSIEDQLGAPIPSFAYPYAFPSRDLSFTTRFRAKLKESQFENCVTTAIGRVTAQDDLFMLKRLPANACDDEALIQAKLDGAYDWLAVAQNAIKSMKTTLRRGEEKIR